MIYLVLQIYLSMVSFLLFVSYFIYICTHYKVILKCRWWMFSCFFSFTWGPLQLAEVPSLSSRQSCPPDAFHRAQAGKVDRKLGIVNGSYSQLPWSSPSESRGLWFYTVTWFSPYNRSRHARFPQTKII